MTPPAEPAQVAKSIIPDLAFRQVMGVTGVRLIRRFEWSEAPAAGILTTRAGAIATFAPAAIPRSACDADLAITTRRERIFDATDAALITPEINDLRFVDYFRFSFAYTI